jgi:hypothetical protein
MIKLIIPILLQTSALNARISDIDYVEGKLIQVVDSNLGECGSEGFVIIQTRTGYRFIYEYVNFKQSTYKKYLGKAVKIIYTESVSRLTDCSAGIKKIEVIK